MRATVNALVDSGSTDIDLNQRTIDALGLQVDASQGPAQFEVAGGFTVESPMYSAFATVLGQTALARVGPSEDTSDEALLGHDALASLGLLVDCRHRRLLAAAAVGAPDGSL